MKIGNRPQRPNSCKDIKIITPGNIVCSHQVEDHDEMLVFGESFTDEKPKVRRLLEVDRFLRKLYWTRDNYFPL